MTMVQWNSAMQIIARAARDAGRLCPQGPCYERVSALSHRWWAAGDCTAPVHREITGRPEGQPKWHEWEPGKRGTLILDLQVRCRQCESCLRARARHWALRAKSEIDAVARTWFGTLTLRPDRQNYYLNLARASYARSGDDLDRQPEEVIFRERAAAIGLEVTRYLKRVRKNSGARLRYVLVFEAHKSGDPHLHMLVHEVGGVVTYRHLSDAWTEGFTKWKLADTGASRYVTKYLSKSMLARVRASVRYGESASVPRPLKTVLKT